MMYIFIIITYLERDTFCDVNPLPIWPGLPQHLWPYANEPIDFVIRKMVTWLQVVGNFLKQMSLLVVATYDVNEIRDICGILVGILFLCFQIYDYTFVSLWLFDGEELVECWAILLEDSLNFTAVCLAVFFLVRASLEACMALNTPKTVNLTRPQRWLLIFSFPNKKQYPLTTKRCTLGFIILMLKVGGNILDKHGSNHWLIQTPWRSRRSIEHANVGWNEMYRNEMREMLVEVNPLGFIKPGVFLIRA